MVQFGTEEKRRTSPYFCISSAGGYLLLEEKKEGFRECPGQVFVALKRFPPLFSPNAFE
jgi:hypothetical protein